MIGDDGTPRGRPGLVLAALVAAFVVPILFAYAFTSGLFGTGSTGRTNKGTLLEPAVDLRDAESVTPLFAFADLAPGEWAIVYVAEAACETRCGETLARLATIRSVLGYAGQRVRIVALAPAPSGDDLEPPLADYVLAERSANASVRSALAAAGTVPDGDRIVFADWRRQLVLHFPPDAPSIDIKKDLKKLLRASRVR